MSQKDDQQISPLSFQPFLVCSYLSTARRKFSVQLGVSFLYTMDMISNCRMSDYIFYSS